MLVKDYRIIKVGVIAAVTSLLLSGCSVWNSFEETIWPIDDEEQITAESTVDIPQQGAVEIASSGFDVDPATSDRGFAPDRGFGPPEMVPPSDGNVITGTFVGGKVAQLRYEFNNLTRAIDRHQQAYGQVSQRLIGSQQSYHGLVSAITARLRIGTTPGNPILVGQWIESHTLIDALSADLWQMYMISNRNAADSGMIDYLLNTVQSVYRLPGGVDEDHTMLRTLEGDVEQLRLRASRFTSRMDRQIETQNRYLGQQRSEILMLDVAVQNGSFIGPSLGVRNPSSSRGKGTRGKGISAVSGGTIPSGSPLVLIKAIDRKVAYEDALYQALQQVLDTNSSAGFTIVAVTPKGRNIAASASNSASVRRKAEEVMRSMAKMGIPPERTELIALSDNVKDNEIRIFVR